MSPPPFYSLTWVPASHLPPGDRRDPFRFFRDGEGAPPPGLDPVLSMLAWEREGDRRLGPSDAYFYVADGNRRFQISPEAGSRILNHFLDPQVLRQRNLGVLVRASERPFETEDFGGISLENIPEISAELREQILHRPYPYWEADGHLDLDILEGLRNYQPEENRAYAGLRGMGIYFDGPYAGRQLGVTALVAGGFMAGEHLTNSPFMWQTYTTNFLSSIAGSIQHHGDWNEALRRSETFSTLPEISRSERRLANMDAAEARGRMARDHLYWAFMTPIVIGACLADANFRHFLRSPGILPRHFVSQFGTAAGALSRSPLAFGLAGLSAFGIYEISSAWFDLYGGLRSGSAENRIFSGVSTFLVEMALLSRPSRELHALTGSGALTFRNLRTLAALRPQWGVVAEIPEGSWLARRWLASPRLQALFQRAPLPSVMVSSEVGPTALLNRMGIPRLALEARVPAAAGVEAVAAVRTVSSESLLARSVVASRAAVLAETEGVVAARAVTSLRGVRVAGLPLLGLVVGAGLLLGGAYLTGYFNDRFTPRDLLRRWTGH